MPLYSNLIYEVILNSEYAALMANLKFLATQLIGLRIAHALKIIRQISAQ